MSMMKRSREDATEVEAQAMANICMKLLSRFDQVTVPTYPVANIRVYECKTCDKKFSSFQALGGHRTSHKKPKLMTDDYNNLLPVKPKKHECTICGVEFALGQALGGHMRRHRLVMGNSVDEKNSLKVEAVPILKRCNSSKRVLCLDLNLMPYDVDLKLGW